MVLCFDSEIEMLLISWNLDSLFVFHKWGTCCWNEQWIGNGIPDFEDLILKLGWMFWAIN